MDDTFGEDIFVGQLMSTDVHAVTPDTLVEEAAALMLDNDIGSVVVVDDEGKLQGILTTTDFVDIVAKSHPKAQTAVSRYMTTDVITTGADVSIRDVADAMIEHGFHHVPVVDGDEVIGMVTSTDLAAYLSHVQTTSPS
jgi:CBS domain-containing protein